MKAALIDGDIEDALRYHNERSHEKYTAIYNALGAHLPTLVAQMQDISGSRVYGPFFGKVVDSETGEPIEGAVVLIGIYTKGGSVGGWVYSFADALEILTDSDGKFFMSAKRVDKFRAMSIWDKDCVIAILKPDYASYPGHPVAFSSWKYKRARYIPEKENILYYLPKLSTIDERKKNLFNILHPIGTPNEKMPNMIRLEREERVAVGL